jgi:hypothetical protein
MTDAMNKSDAIAQLTRDQLRRYNRYAQTLDLVDSLPESLNIDVIDAGSIYLASATYAENMETLHEIRKGHELTLNSYYLSGFSSSKTLALSYGVDPNEDGVSDFYITMYCTDLDNALEHVGQGRCKVVETPVTYTEKRVVCDM